jgi:hypothetical protein
VRGLTKTGGSRANPAVFQCGHYWSLEKPSYFLVVYSNLCDVRLTGSDKFRSCPLYSDEINNRSSFSLSIKNVSLFKSIS